MGVLLIVTAAREVRRADGSSGPAGYEPSEVIALCDALSQAGREVVIATPAGEAPTPDPRASQAQVAAAERIEGLATPRALPEVEDAGAFEAVVLAGGPGAVSDLARNPLLGRILRQTVEGAIPVGAVGHGPAGLLAADQSRDDPWPFAGLRMTCVSDAELGEPPTFSVEGALRGAGADVDVTQQVVVDGLLVTGRDSAGAAEVGRAVAGLIA
jgi:putative intracellular protease/amidase